MDKRQSILNIIHGYSNSEDMKSISFSKFPERINPIWVTKSGERIPVSTMSTTHLERSLKSLLGRGRLNNERIRAWIEVLEKELNRRGME